MQRRSLRGRSSSARASGSVMLEKVVDDRCALGAQARAPSAGGHRPPVRPAWLGQSRFFDLHVPRLQSNARAAMATGPTTCDLAHKEPS